MNCRINLLSMSYKPNPEVMIYRTKPGVMKVWAEPTDKCSK